MVVIAATTVGVRQAVTENRAPVRRQALMMSFMDLASIDAGVDFVEAIGQAVSSCAVLLALT